MRRAPLALARAARRRARLPLALAVGPGAEVRSTIGLVIIGGVLSATLMALLLVPAFYLVMTGGTRSRAHHEQALLQQRERDRERSADRGSAREAYEAREPGGDDVPRPEGEG